MGEDERRVKEEVAANLVDHMIQSKAAIATPGDPAAKVRREVLRGLARANKDEGRE